MHLLFVGDLVMRSSLEFSCLLLFHMKRSRFAHEFMIALGSLLPTLF